MVGVKMMMSIKRFDCVAAKRRLRKEPRPMRTKELSLRFQTLCHLERRSRRDLILCQSPGLKISHYVRDDTKGQSQTENILHHYDNIEIIAGPFIFFRVE